jgi:hypothetical protein
MSGNANNSPKPPPLIKAAGLWQKSSVKGGQYLTGRLGGMKVLILENRERQSDDDPSHHLFITEVCLSIAKDSTNVRCDKKEVGWNGLRVGWCYVEQ